MGLTILLCNGHILDEFSNLGDGVARGESLLDSTGMRPQGDQPMDEQLSTLPPGTHIVVHRKDGGRWEGWLLPRDPYSPPESFRLKLSSGYNIGLSLREVASIETIGGAPWGEVAGHNAPPNEVGGAHASPDGARVTILTTGGTIASYVDYTTGGVKPMPGWRALEALFPDDPGRVVLKDVFDILSEDIGPEHWERLAEEVQEAFQGGARGVVITHGTDTMAYTASALAFQLRDLPGPVVLVGAQRSIDRPSSDGIFNMRCAVQVAREADLGEVVVVMHSDASDIRADIHRGTRVRKMHSTRRDAFRTLNSSPLGWVDAAVHLTGDHRSRAKSTVKLEKGFDRNGRMLWIHPGITPEEATAATVGARGVLLVGTGMGHVPSQLLAWIRDQGKAGTLFAMTTQCLGGTVDPYVYSRGRELASSGVVYLGDMLPETAFVKLLWALHRAKGREAVEQTLGTDLAGEMSPGRSLFGERESNESRP